MNFIQINHNEVCSRNLSNQGTPPNNGKLYIIKPIDKREIAPWLEKMVMLASNY